MAECKFNTPLLNVPNLLGFVIASWGIFYCLIHSRLLALIYRNTNYCGRSIRRMEVFGHQTLQIGYSSYLGVKNTHS